MINTLTGVLALLITVLTVTTSFAQCTNANAIYVTPGGNGNGTSTNPASFTGALQMFRNDTTRPIIMSGGDYAFYNTIVLPSGINI